MNNNIAASLSEKIAAARRARQMTQGELAELLCITPQAISKWETGTGLPDLTILPALAAALGVSVGELLGEAVPPAGPADFPETWEGMTIAGKAGNVACYSSKTVAGAVRVEETGEVTLTFTDGSTARLDTQTAINCGPGEIRFLGGDSLPFSLPANSFERKSREETFPLCQALHIDLRHHCCLEVVESEEEVCRVEAQGTALMLSLLELATAADGLHVKLKSLNHGRPAGEDHNTIKVHWPRSSRSEALSVSISGSGEVSVAPAFEHRNLSVSGSGTIRLGDGGPIRASVAGSGSLTFGDATGDCHYNIAGSGDMTGRHLGDTVQVEIAGSGAVTGVSAGSVKASIAGSGDLSLERAEGDQEYSIAGSGDVSAKQLRAGRLCAEVNGSGDIHCAGEAESLHLELNGGAGFEGKGLTVDTAEITGVGTPEIVIGHIRRQSTERLGKSCSLQVLRRGE